MSIRILHVIGDSKFGGGTGVILRLAQFSREQGWHVEILATDPTTLDAAAQAGIPTVQLEAIWRDIRPLRDLAGLYRLYCYLRNHPYTVIHTHTTKAGFIGRLAARWAGVPAIFHTAHGFAFHEASGKAKIAFYCVLEWLASRCCDFVITVSRFHRDWNVRLGAVRREQCIAIPNGITPTLAESALSIETRVESMRDKLGIASETVVILTHGRLAPEKGLEHLIQAAHGLDRRLNREFVVLIAGDGELRRELERLVKALGLEHRVRFLGFRHDVRTLVQAADIVALPSVREGLSIALLEAMSMGCPIVATSIGGNREATREGEGALLIPPHSAEALEEALWRLAQDRNEAERLAARAREIYRAEYTAGKMLASYHQLYLDVLVQKKLLPADGRALTAAA